MDPFILKLLFSFFVGAVWITTATVIAERFGPTVGGILTGIPSTIVISLLFIGWTQSLEIAATAMTITPAMIGLAAIFTATYILLSRYSLFISLGVSLVLWFFLSSVLIILQVNTFALSFLLFLFSFVASYAAVERWGHIVPQQRFAIRITPAQVFFRAGISGTIIALAVVIAKVGGPILGGIFAAFPAVMLSTIIITHRAFFGGRTADGDDQRRHQCDCLYTCSAIFLYNARTGVWHVRRVYSFSDE